MKLEFTINRVTYKVPEIIDIDTFERAIVWNLDDLKNLKPFVATIVQCPLSALNLLDDEVLAFITGTCLQKIQAVRTDVIPSIHDNDLIDLENLTFGQWIDLDTLISMGAGTNLSKIVEILYDHDKVGHWDSNLVWGAVKAYAEYRTRIYKEYDEFFELNDTNEGPQPEPSEPSESNIQLMWWESIMALTDGDFLKIHQVVERPFREALNYLTWKKAQVQKEKLNNLKAKNQLRKTR